MSLLLEREDFGAILESTLAGFWQERLGVRVAVRWAPAADGYQRWHGHPYLNFFAIPAADPACFDVVRKEYSYSPRPWLRPLQKAYVALALAPALRRHLCTVSFSVAPAIPDAATQLIVPGNHRLRILRPHEGRVDVLHKAGFPRLPFQRELAARRGAAAAIAPALLTVDPSGTWFTEAYFSGTPANRLHPRLQAQVREQACALLRDRVHAPTATAHRLLDHAASLVERITKAAPPLAGSANCILEALAAGGRNTDMVTVASHGDFQDANILLSPDQGIRIIDWEFSDRRSRFYDMATLASGIRLSRDWIACWRACARSWTAHPQHLAGLATVDTSTALPQRIRLWLLEELLLRVEQPLMRPPTDAGPHFEILASQLRLAAQEPS